MRCSTSTRCPSNMPKYSPPPPFSSPTLAPTFLVLFCAGSPPAHVSASGWGHRVAQQPRRVRLPRPRPCCSPSQVQLQPFFCCFCAFVTKLLQYAQPRWLRPGNAAMGPKHAATQPQRGGEVPTALPLKPNQPNLLLQLLLHDNRCLFSHALSLPNAARAAA
jgi:hypothetical protein